ncbi:MAG: type II toxin-antitoxin system VapC family toxin [Planctomycetes bacterium]|nr:type II toxin-antitoxin system VapC family toxin [Planctomycetota bacterium]
MAVYMMDSSAIVKRYASEIGSAWIMGITDPAAGNEIWVVRITAVEVVSALARRVRGGSIDPVDGDVAIALFKNDLQDEYQIIEVTEALVDRAMALAEKHVLRGYDAVQLAAAFELNAILTASGLVALTFVAADAALNAAAVAEGLKSDDPNSHP